MYMSEFAYFFFAAFLAGAFFAGAFLAVAFLAGAFLAGAAFLAAAFAGFSISAAAAFLTDLIPFLQAAIVLYPSDTPIAFALAAISLK